MEYKENILFKFYVIYLSVVLSILIEIVSVSYNIMHFSKEILRNNTNVPCLLLIINYVEVVAGIHIVRGLLI